MAWQKAVPFPEKKMTVENEQVFIFRGLQLEEYITLSILRTPQAVRLLLFQRIAVGREQMNEVFLKLTGFSTVRVQIYSFRS